MGPTATHQVGLTRKLSISTLSRFGIARDQVGSMRIECNDAALGGQHRKVGRLIEFGSIERMAHAPNLPDLTIENEDVGH